MNQPTEQQVREDFRRHLIASGRGEETAAEVATAINLTGFTDANTGAVDTAKLHEFAARFGISAGRRRSFGGGNAHGHPVDPYRGPGQLEAERRFGKAEGGAGSTDAQGPTSFRSAEAKRRFGGET